MKINIVTNEEEKTLDCITFNIGRQFLQLWPTEGNVEYINLDNVVSFTVIDSNKTPGWVEIKGPESLPSKDDYDWVLVACYANAAGFYTLPQVAELRHGVWYREGSESSDDIPLEEAFDVTVTHWAPLLMNPVINKEEK